MEVLQDKLSRQQILESMIHSFECVDKYLQAKEYENIEFVCKETIKYCKEQLKDLE